MSATGSSIAERLGAVREELASAARDAGREPSEIRLVAVSKRVGTGEIAEAAEAGQVDFGESYVQEALVKIEAVHRPGLRWHLVGQLQSNKAARAARGFDLIHSLASLSAARTISKAMTADSRVCSVLVQTRLDERPGRGGVAGAELEGLVRAVSELPGLRIDGVMGVAPLGEPARPSFAELRRRLERLRALALPNAPLKEMSAGMSDDYRDAILEGATLIRLGRAIFGV